jgi:hypothetical protein
MKYIEIILFLGIFVIILYWLLTRPNEETKERIARADFMLKRSEERYKNNERQNHDHLPCIVCGKIFFMLYGKQHCWSCYDKTLYENVTD